MTKKIDPSLKKKPGRKATMMDETKLNEWRVKLERAILMAHGNLNVIKKDTFWSIGEIRSRWGNKAVREFKYWFESKKHFNHELSDALLLEFESGKLTEEKYKRLLYSQCYSWMWILNDKRERDVWKLTRKLNTINELTKEKE